MGCCGGDVSGIRGWFQRTGIYGYLLVGLLIIVAAYFVIVHQVHLAAYSSIIFLVIFIGLHLVTCGMGHGSHGDPGGGGCGGSHEYKHGEDTKEGEADRKSAGTADEENKKGGSCH